MPLAGAVADPRTHALALAAAALAAACFIGMDSTAKLLGERYGTTQVTFLRFAMGALYAVPLWLWRRTPLPARPQWRWHLLRSGLLMVALLTWFYALKQLPLVQAVGVGYTAPLFIALLAMWVLRERPSRWIWAALAVGALGVGVALWPELSATDAPGSEARLWGMAAAGVSAITYAGVVVVARHQAQHDALWTILLVQNLLPVLVLAVPMAWLWQPMLASDIPILLLMGALATGGLLCITWAFSHIEASRAAPVEYTGLVWAALLGFAVFGEVPTVWSLSSAALITLGCLLLVRR
ncbi:DMT family transporter [Pseudaquabacterium pictum]|uniref:DMT family transporter n=1 Tax=Pseudaquabacterium pictum TaxID=2315236 RepID=UPI001D14D99E|nr:DMT family transporter [Rubrivivax pictus]